ncbi:MAG: hypothetical protein KDA24_27565 [Deltaproteobacteria bacterium]|nr:hypothetical protein [Deltaproteobacteria bacterium]
MRPSLCLLLLLAMALRSTPAMANPLEEVPRLALPAALVVADVRSEDRRGDAWLGVDGGGALGPERFSLRREVAVLSGLAAAPLRLPLLDSPGDPALHRLRIDVRVYECADTFLWGDCSASLEGHVRSPSGGEYSFAIEGGAEEPGLLRDSLVAKLRKELEAAQAAVGLGLSTEEPQEAPHLLQVGRVEDTDGFEYLGQVASGPGDVCIGSGGAATRLPAHRVAGLLASELPLHGIQPGERWAALAPSEGAWVGGRVLGEQGAARLIWTPEGALVLSPELGAVLTGVWSTEELLCSEAIPEAAQHAHASAGGPGEPEEVPFSGRIVLVEDDGILVDNLRFVSGEVSAIPRGRLGERRWARYRLSWAEFAEGSGSRLARQRLAEFQAQNSYLSRQFGSMMVAGITTALVSGILVGVLGGVSSTYNSDEAYYSSAFAAHGIGAGVVVAVIGGGGAAKTKRRAERPHDYENLLEVYTSDELERVMSGDTGAEGE